MDKLLRAKAFSTRPETGSRGLQTQQGTHRQWKRAQCPFTKTLKKMKLDITHMLTVTPAFLAPNKSPTKSSVFSKLSR
jgi:hypothetical protein